MKVSQLIAKLQELPEDAEVIYTGDSFDYKVEFVGTETEAALDNVNAGSHNNKFFPLVVPGNFVRLSSK